MVADSNSTFLCAMSEVFELGGAPTGTGSFSPETLTADTTSKFIPPSLD
jgi:hypothetical protein